ncbi:MAG TPA: sigma-70 family RNA polymerase sigma factor [Terracidiphilus sp.]|jgi:RNA polymerase sigma-70 factor (ECF subfamily)
MDTCRSDDETEVNLVPAESDEILVEVAKSGDRSAFAELWRRHSKTAFRNVYRITKNRADTEDVIQDAWIKALVHLRGFDGRAAFSSWITRIAINSALMMLRRRRSRPETSMELTDGEAYRTREFADYTENAETHYLRRQSAERLRRAIHELRPDLRTVIEMQQSTDRRVKEIAELAGISVTATKSRLLRARAILRKALE